MSDIDKDLSKLLNDSSVPDSSAPNEYAPVSPEDVAAAEAEAEREKKFGGRPVEAFAGRAASAATLGLSSQILKGLGVSPERLSEVPERSPVAAGLGTVAGIAGPMLATGGTSALAEGAVEGGTLAAQATRAARIAAESSPLNIASKAGRAVEHFTADALKSRVRSKAAREILSKATGVGAEGAILGEGALVDENALGKADLNAENIIASGGAGALLGAGFGTVLGTAQASIPLASKAIEPLANKLKGFAADFTDPAVAMQEVSGLNGKAIKGILKRNPAFFDDAVTYTNTELEHGVLTTPAEIYESNATAIKRNGQAIGQAIDELHAAATGHPELSLTRDEVYGMKLRDGVLKELRTGLEGTAEVQPELLRVIDNYDELLERYRLKKTPMDLKELDNLRKDLSKIKYKFNGTESHNNKAEVADALRSGIRDIVDDVAKRVSATAPEGSALKSISGRLEQANKNYSIGQTLEPGLYNRMQKGSPNSLKFMDIVEAAAAKSILGPAGVVVTGAKKVLQSDLRRNFMILTDMQRQATATQNLIKKSVENFVSRARKPSNSLSLKALVGSGYAMTPDQKPPKDRKQAFANVSANLNQLQIDPELLTTRLAKSTARIQNAAPNTAAQMQQTLVTATNFLSSKLPRPYDSGSGEMFKKAYEPTSMELAKFERYLQAVEHPLSVLDDLEKGTLTTEHVEALKTVYPALYGKLQQETLDQVSSPEGQKMSYSKKVSLGILLDIPTDESLQNYAILHLQNNFVPAEPEQGPKKRINTSEMGMANRAQSGSEQIANRKAQT